MNGIEAIPALGLANTPAATATTKTADSTSFLNAVLQGMEHVEADSNRAADALAALATDPSVPTHDVILAMEQAKLSLQLAAEVRQRIVDAYKELTGMQI